MVESCMWGVAGWNSRRVVSPWDKNVSILAFMFGLLRDVHVWSTVGAESEGLGPSKSYCTVSESCQDGIPAVQMGIATRFSGLTAGVQEIRIGVSCFSRIAESKINGTCRRLDGGKNPHCPLAQWAVQCFPE